jgi:hypothetical protein
MYRNGAKRHSLKSHYQSILKMDACIPEPFPSFDGPENDQLLAAPKGLSPSSAYLLTADGTCSKDVGNAIIGRRIAYSCIRSITFVISISAIYCNCRQSKYSLWIICLEMNAFCNPRLELQHSYPPPSTVPSGKFSYQSSDNIPRFLRSG